MLLFSTLPPFLPSIVPGCLRLGLLKLGTPSKGTEGFKAWRALYYLYHQAEEYFSYTVIEESI